MPTSIASLFANVVKSARAGVILLLLCAMSATAVAAEKLYIFTEKFPPYSDTWSGDDVAHNVDDITGICSDMVKATLSRLDYDYVMKMRAWSYAYNWVQGRKNHALFCTAKTDERADLFQWVGPLTSYRWTLFAAPDSDITLSSLEEAKDLLIAGYKDDVMAVYLEDRGYNVIAATSGEINARRLMLGQADLWVTDGLQGPLVALKEYGVTGLKPVLVFRETPMYLAFSTETDPAIVANFQRALDEARATGELERIVRRYK